MINNRNMKVENDYIINYAYSSAVSHLIIEECVSKKLELILLFWRKFLRHWDSITASITLKILGIIEEYLFYQI